MVATAPQKEPAAEWADPGSLIPNPLNQELRDNEAAIPGVMASIEAFGFGAPLVARQANRMLIAGHTRLEAAKRLALKQIPVRFLDIDQDQADLLMMADNRLGERAGWRAAGVKAAAERFGLQAMALAGWQEREIPGWRPTVIDDDPVSPGLHAQLQATWGTQLGQVWRIGAHRLIVGDSTQTEIVARIAGDERAECCWTDPPYGVDYVGKRPDALKIQGDAQAPDALRAFIEQACKRVVEACRPRSAVYIAHPQKALLLQFWLAAAAAAGLQLSQMLVWAKDSMVLGHSDYHVKHEPILLCYTPGEGRAGRGTNRWFGDDAQATVFNIPRPKRSEEHPTMKPVELVEAMLKNSCGPTGLVFDPFLGSGTTMVAAHQLGMRCMGCEIDPKYAAVILDRMQRLGCQVDQVS